MKYLLTLLFLTRICYAEQPFVKTEETELPKKKSPLISGPNWGEVRKFTQYPPHSLSEGWSKDKSSWKGKLGKANVSLEVEKNDFASECLAKWEKKEKDHLPKAKITISWPD